MPRPGENPISTFNFAYPIEGNLSPDKSLQLWTFLSSRVLPAIQIAEPLIQQSPILREGDEARFIELVQRLHTLPGQLAINLLGNVTYTQTGQEILTTRAYITDATQLHAISGSEAPVGQTTAISVEFGRSNNTRQPYMLIRTHNLTFDKARGELREETAPFFIQIRSLGTNVEVKINRSNPIEWEAGGENNIVTYQTGRIQPHEINVIVENSTIGGINELRQALDLQRQIQAIAREKNLFVTGYMTPHMTVREANREMEIAEATIREQYAILPQGEVDNVQQPYFTEAEFPEIMAGVRHVLSMYNRVLVETGEQVPGMEIRREQDITQAYVNRAYATDELIKQLVTAYTFDYRLIKRRLLLEMGFTENESIKAARRISVTSAPRVLDDALVIPRMIPGMHYSKLLTYTAFTHSSRNPLEYLHQKYQLMLQIRQFLDDQLPDQYGQRQQLTWSQIGKIAREVGNLEAAMARIFFSPAAEELNVPAYMLLHYTERRVREKIRILEREGIEARYPYFPRSILLEIMLRYRDYEPIITHLQETIDNLGRTFQVNFGLHVSESILMRAAIRYTDPFVNLGAILRNWGGHLYEIYQQRTRTRTMANRRIFRELITQGRLSEPLEQIAQELGVSITRIVYEYHLMGNRMQFVTTVPQTEAQPPETPIPAEPLAEHEVAVPLAPEQQEALLDALQHQEEAPVTTTPTTLGEQGPTGNESEVNPVVVDTEVARFRNVYLSNLDEATRAFLNSLPKRMPLATLQELLSRPKTTVIKNQVVEGNLGLVIWVARRYIGQGIEFLDLVQEGTFGLIKAYDKYDQRKGAFSTYAVWWIRQAISKVVKEKSSIIILPRQIGTNVNKVRKAIAALEEAGERVTNENIVQRIQAEGFRQMDVDDVALARIAIERRQTRLLSETVDEEEEIELIETMEDPSATQAYEAAQSAIEAGEEIQELLHLANLTAREMEAIILRFGLGEDGIRYTLEQAGRRMNHISKQRVRELEVNALAKLRTAGSSLPRRR